MVFCDWLSIYQVHFIDLPRVNSGKVFSVDQDGVVQWEVDSKVTHRGSHDTSIRISCDGNRVTLDGNIGRFDRPDNLFGYSVQDCVRLANKLLAAYGLPPFTDTVNPILTTSLNGENLAVIPVGAVITRIDLTRNYVTGSQHNAGQYIRHLQGFKSGRHEPESYRSVGVVWGKGSKYTYAKMYDKAADYIRHRSVASLEHDPVLYAFLRDNGVVRHEISLKSRYLKQNHLWRFCQWDKKMHETIYAHFSDVVTASSRVDEFLEIPGRAGELAVAWRDGADLKKRLSHQTFYRYRRELLGYGIDITIPSNVARLKLRVEVIQVAPCVAPEWYVLPLVA